MNHKNFVETALGYLQARFDNHYSMKNLSSNEQKIKTNIWIDGLKQFNEDDLTFDNLKQAVDSYVSFNDDIMEQTGNYFNDGKPPSIDNITKYLRIVLNNEERKKHYQIKKEEEPSLKEKWNISSEEEKKNMVFYFLGEFNHKPKAKPNEYRQWIDKNQELIKKELKQYKMP